MNPVEFSDRNKGLRSHNSYRSVRQEISIDNLCRSMSVSSLAATIASGTDYAEEYIKKADRELFEASKHFRTSTSKPDDVSLATYPTPDILMNEEQERIYKNYDVTYQSKPNLTIRTVHTKIIDSIKTEPVTIIQGPTGCGKTTQVPQIIWDHYSRKKLLCNIIVTQPRRIAAINIAGRVSAERKCPLGSLVGYKVGLSSRLSSDTRITYCTTGVLLRKLILMKNLNEYTHIIIDEIHERDQDMDFLLLVIRKLLYLNSRKVKIILMSATFKVEKFSKYFASYVGQTLTPARVIDITKRNYFNVSEYYLCELVSLGKLPHVSLSEPCVSAEMIDFARRLITVMDNIDSSSDDTDIINPRPAVLIFLPGIHEIEEMHNALSDLKYKESKWDIVILHSSITNEEQQQIFCSPLKEYRRLILSTNIAESSLTVPDVKYIIDFCLTKQLVRNPDINYQTLEISWASKANCQQRSGRTGRVMDGRVYRLIPKKLYKLLPDENPPEIVRAPLENVVLRTKLLDMGKPQALLALALDPPDLSNLERTVLLLKEVGGLFHSKEDRFDGDITDLGQVMAALPINIHISKMIVLGQVFSVLRESIIIGASMAVKNMFSTPFQQKLNAYNTKLLWANNSSSDCIAFLNAYSVWRSDKANSRIKNDASEKAWAHRKCLQIRVLREIEALVTEIINRLGQLGIKETVGANKITWPVEDKHFIIKIVFAGAFYPHYFTTKVLDDENSKIKMVGGLDPLKTVYLQGWPFKQPGILYAAHFEEKFKKCLNSDSGHIKVKFDNTTRVYIHFGKNNDDRGMPDVPGEISRTVFKALKMRTIENKITISVMNVESAINRAEKLNINPQAPTLLLRSINRDAKPVSILINKIRPNLPGLDVSEISLFITQILGPGHFWAKISSTDVDEKEKKINNYIQSTDFQKFDLTPKVGSLVLAPFIFNNDNDQIEFQRAFVQTISMEDKKNVLVKVFFIDNGRVSNIRACDLRSLPDDNPLVDIPGLAFECVLANVKPFVQNTLSEKWSNEAMIVFDWLTKKKVKKLLGQIYSVVDSVVSLNLICVTQSDETINVNEYLITKKLAQHKYEDYLSEYNNQLRMQAAQFSNDEKEYIEDMQHYSIETYPTPPSLDECSSYVTLRGPFSPLEVTVASLSKAGLGKKVNIADCSVNSILLEPILVNPPERLLVAESVTQGAVSKNLTLRNTTLMPNIPGLISLIALIFAPQIELRRNEYGTRYTGALCGLGYYKETKLPLFNEHDMAIVFDVEITMDDLSDINRLRHYMSTGISVTTEDDDNTESTLQCQSKVRDIFKTIIFKDRKKIPPEIYPNQYHWCKYEPDLFLNPGSASNIKKNIFKLHWALDLKEKDDNRECMIEHLKELRSIASLSFKEDTGEMISCSLCQQNVFGIIQLRSHLNSELHRLEENRICYG